MSEGQFEVAASLVTCPICGTRHTTVSGLFPVPAMLCTAMPVNHVMVVPSGEHPPTFIQDPNSGKVAILLDDAVLVILVDSRPGGPDPRLN